MAAFDQAEDRPTNEAEELMRQKRFADAAARYHDLRRREPSDLWFALGHASALECAGDVDRAQQILDEAAVRHRAAAPLHRFRRLFFVRREDVGGAAASRLALEQQLFDDGPVDQLADLYFNQGRYREAQAELERLLRDDEDGGTFRASLLARLGACLRQLGEYDHARGMLLQALALDDDAAWTLVELAETERGMGDNESARRHYQDALELRGDDHFARAHLAQVEHESGNSDRAVELYEAILEADPKLTWAKIELAQVLSERDRGGDDDEQDPAAATGGEAPPAESQAEESDRDRAVALCKSALRDDPEFPWAHAQLGQLAKQAGDAAAARVHFLRAHAASPQTLRLIHELADACRRCGHRDEAWRLLDRALEIDPNDATTHGYRADALRNEGKPEQAVAHLIKAVELDPGYAWAWRELAELHALSGRPGEAESAAEEAIRLEPGAAVGEGLRAFLLRCRDERSAAIPHLERAVEREPTYLWAWRELAETHLMQGRAEAAETTAKRALEVMPEAQPLWGLLAEAHRRRGQRGEAAAALQRAAALGDLPPQLLAMRAELAAAAGEHDAALAAAEQAVRRDGGDDYRLLVAQVLANAGRLGDALAALAAPLEKNHLGALELACILHERQGDAAAALAICERALVICSPNDGDGHGGHPEIAARLTVRSALLARQLNRPVAAQPLATVFTVDPDAVPWRDAAVALAASGNLLDARRAAWRQIERAESEATADEPDADAATAWLTLAETELAGQHLTGARLAAERAVARDGRCLPARLLAAALAEQAGEPDAAIAHLRAADAGLAEISQTVDPVLLRQLARLLEHRDQTDAALAIWDRLCAKRSAGDQPASSEAKHAAAQAERSRLRLAGGQLGLDAPELAIGDPSLPEVQHLRRSVALARARSESSAAAAAWLKAQPELDPTNRVLLARLLLDAGKAKEAADLIAAITGITDPGLDRLARSVEIRARFAAGDRDGARKRADIAWQSVPPDDELAVILAECLLACRDLTAARAALDDPRLPTQPTLARGLLSACLAIEQDGLPAGLARLGRLPVPAERPPLVRLFSAAWPRAWAPSDPAQPVSLDDVRSIPPLPRLVAAVASALIDAKRIDLAAELALAAVCTRLDATLHEIASAVAILHRAGRHREARTLAFSRGGWRTRLAEATFLNRIITGPWH